MKRLFAKYKCKKCDYEHDMCWAIDDSGKPWKSTTCMNEETMCSDRKKEDKLDEDGHPKLPKKTSKLIKSWKE